MLRGIVFAIVVLVGAVRAEASCTRRGPCACEPEGTVLAEIELTRVDVWPVRGKVIARYGQQQSSPDGGSLPTEDEVAVTLPEGVPAEKGMHVLSYGASGELGLSYAIEADGSVVCSEGTFPARQIAEAITSSDCAHRLEQLGVEPFECNDTGCMCGSAAFSGLLALVPLVLRRRRFWHP